jgi:Domain of unknown function (DUF4167)
MRSSKKRSRSSQNRPRTLGNIINRVFDSSGPEGKVRGTPQQIIEKYQMLARDAQLSNDRVAAENFLQHAEHYTRMLAEATREMAAEQEARQLQYQQSGGQQGGQYGNQQGAPYSNQNGGQNGGQNGNPSGGQARGERQDRGDRQDRGERQDRSDRQERGERQDRGDRRPEYGRDDRDPAAAAQPQTVDVIDLGGNDDSGLIETPESAPRPRVEATPVVDTGEPAVARRPRGPRKPKADAASDGAPPKEAAE